jgi:hypothetical protein
MIMDETDDDLNDTVGIRTACAFLERWLTGWRRRPMPRTSAKSQPVYSRRLAVWRARSAAESLSPK